MTIATCSHEMMLQKLQNVNTFELHNNPLIPLKRGGLFQDEHAVKNTVK